MTLSLRNGFPAEYCPVTGKQLSTNDYTTAEKNKLAGIAANANVNTIEKISVNGSEVTPDVNKTVSLTIITKDVNNLTNYYTKSQTYAKGETYTKTEVDSKVSAVYKYKGSVASYSNLPSTGLTIGDVYNVEDTGDNYAWTGTLWDKLSGTVDLSNYQSTTICNDVIYLVNPSLFEVNQIMFKIVNINQ